MCVHACMCACVCVHLVSMGKILGFTNTLIIIIPVDRACDACSLGVSFNG